MYAIYILPKICIISIKLTKDDVHSSTMVFLKIWPPPALIKHNQLIK